MRWTLTKRGSQLECINCAEECKGSNKEKDGHHKFEWLGFGWNGGWSSNRIRRRIGDEQKNKNDELIELRNNSSGKSRFYNSTVAIFVTKRESQPGRLENQEKTR